MTFKFIFCLTQLADFYMQLIICIEGEKAASFCHQVTALVRDMFCNFYLVKNHKIANNSATTEAREKISTDLESLEFQKFFDIGLTIFQNNQILHNKISHIFHLTNQAIQCAKEPHFHLELFVAISLNNFIASLPTKL